MESRIGEGGTVWGREKEEEGGQQGRRGETRREGGRWTGRGAQRREDAARRDEEGTRGEEM